MSKQFLETSLLVALLSPVYRCYRAIDQRLDIAFQTSRTHRLIGRNLARLAACFDDSFLGIISSPNRGKFAVLVNSRIVQYPVVLYKRLRPAVEHYSRTSLTVGLIKDSKKQFYFLSVKMLSTALIAAISLNILLSLAFNRQTGVCSWFMQGALLLVSIPGLFCAASWQEALRASKVYRHMIRNNKR